VLYEAPGPFAFAVNFGVAVGTLACAITAAGPTLRLKYSREPPSAKNAAIASYSTPE
jgi:hypothetical protein